MARRAVHRHQQLTCQATRLRTELAELARGSRARGGGPSPPRRTGPVDRADAIANPDRVRFRVAILLQRLAQVEQALARLDPKAQTRPVLGAIGRDRSGATAPARSVHHQHHVQPPGRPHGEPITQEARQSADHA